MTKTDCGWAILYSSCSGIGNRVLEFLTRETGKYILRETGTYAVYTLPCLNVAGKNENDLPEKNLIIVGTLTENALLRRFIQLEELPPDGSLVRVIPHPVCEGKQIVLIAALTQENVLYGAVDFVERFLPLSAPQQSMVDNPHYRDRFFSKPFPVTDFANAPHSTVRSIFTWGHTIHDFRKYFQDLARLKFNRVIIWNEYPPVNAREVQEYANSWGIRIYWGFAWGWSTNCAKSFSRDPETLSDAIAEEWRTVWRDLGGDGIYFQTFTELWRDQVDGSSVAENAVALVNMTAKKILAEKPDLKIIFGLHAPSVKEQLDVIAQTDPRLEILWENCGDFPHNSTGIKNPEADLEFVRKVLEEKNRKKGFAVKCQMMMDWGNFKHQAGPYMLGCASEDMREHDQHFADVVWGHLMPDWLTHGRIAYDLVKCLHAAGEDIELNLVGSLSGTIRFPTRLMAALFWRSDEAYDSIFRRCVSARG